MKSHYISNTHANIKKSRCKHNLNATACSKDNANSNANADAVNMIIYVNAS